MISINQIKSVLKTIQTSHDQLNDFYFGDFSDLGTEGAYTYPILAADILPGTLSKNVSSLRLTLVVADKMKEDQSNKTEVLSDTHQTIHDVYSQLHRYFELNGVTIPFDASISDINEGWNDDWVAGFQLEIGIDQFYSYNTCQVPSSFLPGVDTGGQVLILNQDGDTIATLNPGQTYTVTELTNIIQNLGTPVTTIVQDIPE